MIIFINRYDLCDNYIGHQLDYLDITHKTYHIYKSYIQEYFYKNHTNDHIYK